MKLSTRECGFSNLKQAKHHKIQLFPSHGPEIAVSLNCGILTDERSKILEYGKEPASGELKIRRSLVLHDNYPVA